MIKHAYKWDLSGTKHGTNYEVRVTAYAYTLENEKQPLPLLFSLAGNKTSLNLAERAIATESMVQLRPHNSRNVNLYPHGFMTVDRGPLKRIGSEHIIMASIHLGRQTYNNKIWLMAEDGEPLARKLKDWLPIPWFNEWGERLIAVGRSAYLISPVYENEGFPQIWQVDCQKDKWMQIVSDEMKAGNIMGLRELKDKYDAE